MTTDKDALLREARERISHEKDCAFIRVGLLKCTCYHQGLYDRITAALAGQDDCVRVRDFQCSEVAALLAAKEPK